MDSIRELRVGDARVTLINAGDMTVRMADEYAGVPESAWRQDYTEAFDPPARFPSLSVLIQAGGVTALVDANDYRATVTPDSGYFTPDYTPPPPIAGQLAALGVTPDAVDHVVITHAHWDHYAGITRSATGGGMEPVYPRARVYLGQGDWDDAEMRANLEQPDSLEARTLGVMYARGLLELVSGPREIAPGITIIPAPGETPGHQIVRVHSHGETLYILGDLLHHEAEIPHPDWMVSWAEPETMRASKARLVADALSENALLTAAHIASIGRLEKTAAGVRWSPVP